MSRILYRKYLIAVFAVLTLGLLGCAGSEKDKGPSAEDLYKDGVKEFTARDYGEAAKVFKKILDEFPNSKLRPLVLLGMATAQYKNDAFDEALFSFERFIEQYPAHPQAPKAYYFKAMCSFRQMESYSRDQTNTKLSLESFEKLINTFSDGKYVKLAKEKKEICRRQLAKNILYIGKYYFGIGAYQSVISRMYDLIADYPEQKFLDEATFLLGESYLKEGNTEKASLTFEGLIQQFPKSSYKSEASSRLASIKKE